MGNFFSKSVILGLGLVVCGACDAGPEPFDGGEASVEVDFRPSMGVKFYTNLLGGK
jgi:hypothetical protein